VHIHTEATMVFSIPSHSKLSACHLFFQGTESGWHMFVQILIDRTESFVSSAYPYSK
jgi:hypothetical protein